MCVCASLPPSQCQLGQTPAAPVTLEIEVFPPMNKDLRSFWSLTTESLQRRSLHQLRTQTGVLQPPGGAHACAWP